MTTSFSDSAKAAFVGYLTEGAMPASGPDLGFVMRLKREMRSGFTLCGAIIDDRTNTAADYRLALDLDENAKVYLGVLDRTSEPYFLDPECLRRSKALARIVNDVCKEFGLEIVVTNGRHPKFSG